MPHRLEPVHRRGTAQHTDVFVVHPQQLVPAQPQREHPRLGKGRKCHGVPPQLVEDGGDLCAGGVIHALILFQQRAHKIVDLDGRVGQGGKASPAVGAKLCHKIVAAVQPHALGVGEHPAGGCCAAGQVAQRHGRGDLQHDVRGCAGRFLAGVDGGGEFRVAEQVHHTVVADTVAAAEFPVGVVVGHAPAKAARHARLGDAVVQHSGVVQRLHQTVRFIVKGLGGEVLAAEFADEVALAGVRGHGGAVLAARAAPGVGIIVVGVNVLQQLAFAGAAGARRGAGGVQPVDGFVGALIKGLVVGAAADAGTPQKDAGMVAVLAHHLPAVL